MIDRRRLDESYNDKIARLYPEESSGRLELGGKFCRSITFQTNENCNLCCTYCYEGHKTDRVMTLEVAKKAIDILLSDSELCKNYCNISDDPAVILDFIGGEPTLQLDLIDQICDYFEEQTFLKKLHIAHRFMISMSTNGTLCSTEKFRNFKKKWGHRFSYGVTVDGDKKLHDSCRVFPDGSGSFDLAIASAKEALAENPQSSTKFTLAPENIDYLIDALKYDIDMGYQIIHINCVYEEGWTIEHAKTLYKNFKEVADYILENDKEDIIISIFDENACHPMSEEDNQNYCGGANGLMLAIDVEGNFYPCMRYMPISIGQDQEPYIIGDLEHGLCNTPEHKARLDACNNITRKSQSTDECFNCPIATGCGWCSAYNYQCTGTVNKRVTYICPTHKARALYNCYYWNKLYRKRGERKRYLLHIPDDWALEIIDEEELKMLKDLAKEG